MIKAVAFDLGHVVLEANINSQLIELGITEPWGSISQWDVHWNFETGKITTPHFYENIRKRFGLKLSDEQIQKSWKAIVRGFVPGMRELLEELSQKTRVVAISNTNQPHYEMFFKMAGFESFEKIYASHLVGFRKPHKEIYLHVLNDMGLKPSELMFFDDLPENVQGAKAVGIEAYEVYMSSEKVKGVLEKTGLLEAKKRR